MSRPLDFLVFGIPRSGTKGLVRLLNLHPHIYCAMERFGFREDHSRIRFPESFVDRRGLWDEHDLTKVARLTGELAGKDDVSCVGNKLPRYYLALDRLNREVPALKNIWIYRSPFGFMQSWNGRERSQKSRWRAGQVGLFGLVELFYCIRSVLHLPKDVLLFPFECGLIQSAEPIMETYEFLGVPPTRFDRAAFETRLSTKPHGTSHRRSLEPYEAELLETLRVRDLDEILAREHANLVSEVAPQLQDYMRSVAPLLPRALDSAFDACDNLSASNYGKEFFHRNRQELASFAPLTEASEAIASFRRFGFYRRLTFFYEQRRALRRRLAAIRPPAIR